MTDQDIDELVIDMTLKIFHTGSNPINYKILKLLPTDVKTLMSVLNLTKVPVNNRVNALMKIGFIVREMGTGRVFITPFGEIYLKIFNSIEEDVKKNIIQMLKNNMD